MPLRRIKNNCERPLTVEIDKSIFASIIEARLVDYARMRLSPEKGQPLTLISSLHGEVHASIPMTTPWQVIQRRKVRLRASRLEVMDSMAS